MESVRLGASHAAHLTRLQDRRNWLSPGIEAVDTPGLSILDFLNSDPYEYSASPDPDNPSVILVTAP